MAGTSAVLRGAEHHHLARVLRARPGDRVWLFDEEGRRYRAEVNSLREREAGFEPVSLGRTILRAETAALAVLTVFAHEWNW